jgi:predicted amidohydrolase YtcJ
MKQLIAILCLVIFTASCDSANNERPSAKYEEKKKSLEDIERDNPLKFLKITGDHHGNMLNQVVIEAEIHNSATLVAYKDIEVKMTFKDKGGSVIEKDTKTVNEIVDHGSTKAVKIKIKKPKGTSSVTFDIVGAVPDK